MRTKAKLVGLRRNGNGKIEIACVDLPFEEFYCEREVRDRLITGGVCQGMGILNFLLLDCCLF